MAPRRTNTEREPTRSAAREHVPDGEPGPVVRRAPFSDNPTVGARGQRTQQRILDAALRVFGEEGYERCSIDRIAKQAGCSRVSFYQYFSSKEDVFRQLTGQVARQLRASTELLDPLTPDQAGWDALRAWISRHGDIYERYEPVFRAFDAAAESDEAVAGGSARWGERNAATIRSKSAATTLAPRQLDAVVGLFLSCVSRTQEIARILRAAAPVAYPRERIDDALADVWHRALFGLVPDVNVHPPARKRPPRLEFDPTVWDVAAPDHAAADLTPAAQRTRTALLESGREVFVRRGYHATRVDDVVAAAGVSHGAFYRYFENKAELAQLLAAQAMATVAAALAEIPTWDGDGTLDPAALRRWLRRYNATQANETALMRVWIDATLQETSLHAEAAAAFDWGRRRVARFLRPRGFGDDDTEALVMVALLESFGTRQVPATTVDAVAHVVVRGLLGR
jgi:AcrR family transcriptional regulator